MKYISKSDKGYSSMNKGFSLIELLVVISIIGVLLAISTFAMQNARKTSRDSKRKGDLEAIRSAIEMYKSDCNEYPTSISYGPAETIEGTTCTVSNTNVYMNGVPEDPMTGTRDYDYVSNGTIYTLCAALETGGGSVADGCSTASCGGAGIVCNYSVSNP